jgi:hypothetical protein
VERALRLEFLETALGEPTADHALPTARELQERLADTEIRLITQTPETDPTMIEAAWYLHGIASAASRLDLYSEERRRRAFQVSAHVFDVALAEQRWSVRDRLELGFAAQLGYQRGGLEPNAIAIYQRINQHIADGPLLNDLSRLPLEVGTAFLGFDRARLLSLFRRWKDQLSEIRRRIRRDLAGTMFGPLWDLVYGTDDVLRYLTRGDSRALARGKDRLASVVSDPLADLTTRWVSSQLDLVAGEAERGSIWTVLPDDVPRSAREAMTLTEPGVLTLWEPQRQLVVQDPNPLSSEVRRVVMSLPTSAGKTLLAQLFMVSHLASQHTSVCYVAPMRSLGREVRRAIRGRLHLLDRELAPDLPDFLSLEDIAQLPDTVFQAVLAAIGGEQADVDIMTPERLAYLLRHDPEEVLRKYGLFIFDEAHLISDPGRGFTLEWVLSFLHWRTLETHHRIILLSAALGNRGQVQEWIDPRDEGVYFHSDWRGPRRLHAIYSTDVDWPTRHEEPFRSPGFGARAVYDLLGRIRVRLTEGGSEHRLVITEPVGTYARRISVEGLEERSPHDSTTRFYRTVAHLARAVSHGGPVLLVTSTKPAARRMAQAIAELVPPAPSARGIAQFARLRLGDAHPLVTVLEHGVAYHHAALPVDVLDAIEEAIRSEELTFIASTTTLTEGVNLPVRTVVLAETTYEGQPVEALLRGARMLNAMGRAGRACRESEGWVFLTQQREERRGDFDALQVGDDDLRVDSRLASEEALRALAELEDRLREQQDIVFEEAAREIDDFLAFVWFVLVAEEAIARRPEEARLEDALHATLAFTQLNETTRQRYVAVADGVRRTYGETEVSTRRRWVQSGTSIRTARRLDEIVGRVVQGSRGRSDIADPQVALQVLADADAFTALLELPEAPAVWRFKTNETGRYREIDVSPQALLSDWIGGTSVARLAQTYLEEVPAEDYRVEQMVAMVTQFFEHFLSWMIGAVVALANQSLQGSEDDQFLSPPLHLFVRYGVNTMHAVDLLVRGVRSRESATRVAQAAIDDGVDVDGMRNWLGDMSIAEWRTRFNATAPDILDLLEYTRARRGGLLKALLEEGVATVEVAVVDPPDEERGAVVVEAPGDPPASYSLRDAETDRQLADIPTRIHADLESVLRTGLPLQVTLLRTTMSIRLLEE